MAGASLPAELRGPLQTVGEVLARDDLLANIGCPSGSSAGRGVPFALSDGAQGALKAFKEGSAQFVALALSPKTETFELAPEVGLAARTQFSGDHLSDGDAPRFYLLASRASTAKAIGLYSPEKATAREKIFGAAGKAALGAWADRHLGLRFAAAIEDENRDMLAEALALFETDGAQTVHAPPAAAIFAKPPRPALRGKGKAKRRYSGGTR